MIIMKYGNDMLKKRDDMNKTIESKGYKGSIEYSEMDGLFYGKVQGIFSLISYEGKASKSLFRIFMVQWMII